MSRTDNLTSLLRITPLYHPLAVTINKTKGVAWQRRRVGDAMLESQQLGASAVRSPFWADAITFLG